MTEDEIRDYVDQYLRETFRWLGLFNFRDGFEIKKEYGIQIGSYRGRADLVLLADNKPLVVVECKSQGVMAQGPDQLKSYLCASPAQLGIFANSTKNDSWTYLEKIGYNEFVKINRDTFQKRFWEIDEERQKIEQSIKAQTERHIDAIAKERAKQQVPPSNIQKRAEEMIEVEAKKRVTESAIQGAVANKLRQDNASLQREINTLKEKLSSANGCLIKAVVALAVVIMLLFGILGGG